MQPEILLIADEDDVVQDTKCKSWIRKAHVG